MRSLFHDARVNEAHQHFAAVARRAHGGVDTEASLGVMLYEMATGARPHVRDSAAPMSILKDGPTFFDSEAPRDEHRHSEPRLLLGAAMIPARLA